MTGGHRVQVRWRDLDGLGHVNHTVVLTYLEEGRDAWLEAHGIRRETLGQELHRHVPVQVLVARAPDVAHPAGPQAGHQLETREPHAGEGRQSMPPGAARVHERRQPRLRSAPFSGQGADPR